MDLKTISQQLRDQSSVADKQLSALSSIETLLAQQQEQAALSETDKAEAAKKAATKTSVRKNTPSNNARSSGDNGGGLMSGVGKMGIGGGALAAGVGILAAGGGMLLKQMEDMNADAIVGNVKKLLSIGDSFEGGNWKFLENGGEFYLAMTGLGLGLAAFGVGSAVAGVGTAVAEWSAGGDWTQKIKDNVVTLLSIKDEIGDNSAFKADSGSFVLAMTGLGIGLAAFGFGSTVAGVGEAINKFTGNEDWAQNVKDNVVTLLSIKDEIGDNSVFMEDSGSFVLAMTGLGIGLAAFGFGSGVAGVGEAINKFTGNEDWAQNVKDNVITLLSLKDDLGGNLEFIGDAAPFLLAMTGLGAGLAAFGFGSGVAGVGEAINKFTGNEDWAQNVKDRVITLLSLKDELDGVKALKTGAEFGIAMLGLGTGLAVFGVGSVVTGAAEGLAQFTGNEDWAQTVKDRVITLLSIKDEIGDNKAFMKDSGSFLVAMMGIAGGLAVFAAGSAVANLSEGLSQFTTSDDWAQTVKDRVTTLLSINDLFGESTFERLGTTGTFVGVMTGIGTGLAAFGFGSAAVGVGEAINKFTGNEDFAQTVKDRVTTLISITDELSDGDGATSKAGKFTAGMAKIGLGLTALASGDFVGTLGGLGQEIMGFFGAKSPFEKIIEIAENADDLSKGADALVKISEALGSFSNIKISDVDLDFQKMAADLAEAVPFMEKLATGGTLNSGWFDGKEVDFGGGLLDPSLRLDEVASAVGKMNYILSGGSSLPTPDPANFRYPNGFDPDVFLRKTNRVSDLAVAQAMKEMVAAEGDNQVASVTSINQNNVTTNNMTTVSSMPISASNSLQRFSTVA